MTFNHVINLICMSPFGMAHKLRQITLPDSYFSVHAPKIRQYINHLNFYCIKQIDYVFPSVCTVIDHRRRPQPRTQGLISAQVPFVLYTLWRHLWSITVHVHEKMLFFLKHMFSIPCSKWLPLWGFYLIIIIIFIQDTHFTDVLFSGVLRKIFTTMYSSRVFRL